MKKEPKLKVGDVKRTIRYWLKVDGIYDSLDDRKGWEIMYQCLDCSTTFMSSEHNHHRYYHNLWEKNKKFV
jgi:hypothetical protein